MPHPIIRGEAAGCGSGAPGPRETARTASSLRQPSSPASLACRSALTGPGADASSTLANAERRIPGFIGQWPSPAKGGVGAGELRPFRPGPHQPGLRLETSGRTPCAWPLWRRASRVAVIQTPRPGSLLLRSGTTRFSGSRTKRKRSSSWPLARVHRAAPDGLVLRLLACTTSVALPQPCLAHQMAVKGSALMLGERRRLQPQPASAAEPSSPPRRSRRVLGRQAPPRPRSIRP